MSKMRLLLLVTASASLALADLNLTNLGSFGSVTGTIGTGIYVAGPQAPAGTGNIQSFVRIQANTNEQGYNTDFRNVQFDENNSPQFTRSLLQSIVPVFICGNGVGQLPTSTGCVAGSQYYQFGLDINQENNDPMLTLDRLVIATGNIPNQSTVGLADGTQLGASAGFFTGAGVSYGYDAGGAGNLVQLNYALQAGSGQGDLFVYVPRSNFDLTDTYVYLYSEFGRFGAGTENPCTPSGGGFTCAAGAQQESNDGFEEWFVQGASVPPPVPEPASIVLFGTTLAVSLTLLRKKFASKQ